jgi:hypothetical protein
MIAPLKMKATTKSTPKVTASRNGVLLRRLEHDAEKCARFSDDIMLSLFPGMMPKSVRGFRTTSCSYSLNCEQDLRFSGRWA